MLGTMQRFSVLLLLLLDSPLRADIRAGVAQIDITPDYPVRLSGFGGRRTESEGIWRHIKAGALALDDVVWLAVDNLGVPSSMTAEVAKRLGIPVEQLAISCTHTHTAPMLAGVAPTLFGVPIPPEHQAHIDRYTRELTNKLTEVAKAAIADRKPAKLSWGVGSVGFAINRRTKGGPTDHDLPMLAVHGEDGKIRAVVVSYACHCVTLAHNKIGGDWAGCARDAIQDAHPGTIVLVTIGCGADQNPDTRGPGDNTEPAEIQGRAIAGEVDKLLKQFLAPVRGPIVANARNVDLPFVVPTRAQWEEKAKRTDAIGYHAKVNLARLDKGEQLTSQIDYAARTWTFGDDLAMAFLPGEVVVDYGSRLKKELDGRRFWVTAYSNDSPCYIPSERVLKEGGYEGGGAMVYYDKPGPFQPGLEDKIVGAVKESLTPKFAAPFDPAKVKMPPLSPQQSRAKIQVNEGLAVDLVAAEPLIQSPVAIAFGPDGRLWVAEMVDYPSGKRGDFQPGGRISVLSERDVQGRYHTSTVFLDNIPFPTGVTAWRNGVLVCAAPDILYAEDSKGIGKADIVKKLYSGFGTENYQARVNSLEYGLDGWVYGSCGLFGGTIKSFSGVELQLGNRDFRIKPDTGEIEPATGRTQQGRVRDDWDNWFGCDNSNLAWHYPLPDHYIRRNPHAAPSAILKLVSEEPDPNRVFPAAKDLQLFPLSGPPGRATAACGIGVYRDDLLGREYQGNLFTCEPVNLLVHRQVLTPSGSSFAGHRAKGEEEREFLASTDPWFRPVQMRTGPDGCIYIVDMYRYVIEHPRWIPPGELAKVDARAGSTLGRIYRVRSTQADPRPLPRLDQMSAVDLARALETANGPVRDLATQMLEWSGDKSAVNVLEELAVHDRPETMLHAMVALNALGGMKNSIASTALFVSHPGLRRSGLRFSQQFPNGEFTQRDVLQRITDDDGQVRLQLAFTLGVWDTDRAAAALARLVRDSSVDPFLVAAVLSSLRPSQLERFLASLIPGEDANDPPSELVLQVLNYACASEQRQALNVGLDRVLAEKAGRNTHWKWSILAGVFQAVSAQGRQLEVSLNGETRGRVTREIESARVSFSDKLPAEAKVPLAFQVLSLTLLGRDEAGRAEDMKLLPILLGAREPPEIQAAAADALTRIADPSVPKRLLAAWTDAAPALRSHILDLLLARLDGAKAVLDAVEKDTIPARFIDAPRRQRLLKDRDSSVSAKAARLFDVVSNSDRAKLLVDYQDVAAMKGEFERGKLVFANRCSTCHHLNGVGHHVGPDLGQLANKSPAYLLQEILDPNKQVDSRYVEYAAATKSGKVIRGIIAAESATSVTLRAAEGKDETLLRTEIETLESSGRSLMPEGFEKDLSRQDLADVMAYVGAGVKR
jgi:putative membrane-bound dehydrogenase-like protein